MRDIICGGRSNRLHIHLNLAWPATTATREAAASLGAAEGKTSSPRFHVHKTPVSFREYEVPMLHNMPPLRGGVNEKTQQVCPPAARTASLVRIDPYVVTAPSPGYHDAAGKERTRCTS